MRLRATHDRAGREGGRSALLLGEAGTAVTASIPSAYIELVVGVGVFAAPMYLYAQVFGLDIGNIVLLLILGFSIRPFLAVLEMLMLGVIGGLLF